MTTVAMIAGMLPIALGFGADSGFRQPMAVAVIGGLITSTALSLLVVPVVFIYIDRFEQFFIRLIGGESRAERRAVRRASETTLPGRPGDGRRETSAIGVESD
jgi:hypothetical protein